MPGSEATAGYRIKKAVYLSLPYNCRYNDFTFNSRGNGHRICILYETDKSVIADCEDRYSLLRLAACKPKPQV